MSLPPGASGGYLSGMSRASMRRQNDKLCNAVGLPDHHQVAPLRAIAKTVRVSFLTRLTSSPGWTLALIVR
jgi:hypothetical protein